MSNKFENYSAEEFMKLCFADDVKNFWNKFYNWQQGESFYTSDIDPDQKSKILYDAHRRLWNKQCSILKLSTVPTAKHLPDEVDRTKEALVITGRYPRLGSDSIMSIYWHWAGNRYPLKNMQELMNNIGDNIKNDEEYKKLYENLCNGIEKDFPDTANLRHKPDRKVTNILKKFIWCYLQKANTIGGFVLFPRHPSSINSMRGCNSKIRDRFDLTLECIRRYYQTKDDNPLFDVLKEDKDFFRMFGEGKTGFEKYAEFFCLNGSWVENGKVLNLLYDDENENKTGRNVKTLDEWVFSQEPLPQDSDEWWTFYRNIMNRLDARNKQIVKLLSDCSEDDLQRLCDDLRPD